jgi:hypothetical protein
MAEYQNTPVSSGEMAQRFVEFVMMQAQNAAFMLGQIPHPQTGRAEVNLDMAQLLIDQLVMIQEKTKGNLTNDEGRILANALANLQIAYVEVAQKQRPGASVSPAPEPVAPSKPEVASKPEVESPAAGSGESAATGTEGDGKRKFVKSYGS